MEIIIGLVIGVIISVIMFFVLKKKDNTDEILMNKLNESFPKIIDQVINVANQKLGAEKENIKVDMENKRGEISRLIKTIQDELRLSQNKLEMVEKERIGSFSTLKQQLEEQKILTETLKVTTDNLRKVLSNNSMRGQFGEQVAEELLKMSGFVKGIDYDFNKEQKESETRPDFTIYMPDGTKINVDAKFPYANLQKSTETEDKEEKERYIKLFEQDVKQKIKQVTSRDYINPDSNTVDFVILFIPNEMIFSFIYDKLNDVWKDAMEKKVILTGPFSFTALLRLIKQSYDNFRVQKNIQGIVGHVRKLEDEYIKFTDEFDKVGTKIEQLNSQYNTVRTTRINQMNRVMEKIQLDEPDIKDEQPKLI